MPYDVFISYRHSDAAEKACQMASSLKSSGCEVFYDTVDIPDGTFDARIYRAIDDACVFVIILTDGYIERCSEEANWVRWEVEYAFRSGKKIVPVYFGDDPPVLTETVTGEIRHAIGSQHFSQIGNPGSQLYQSSIKTLISDRISPELEKSRNTAFGPGAEIHIETDIPCRVKRNHTELIVAYPEKSNVIRLGEGEHLLEFISIINGMAKDSRIYEVNNIQACKIIDIKLKPEVIKYHFFGHDYVDLGLPSGTLWATCNVGASKLSDYGDYFAWGETSPKKSYDWSNLKYCNYSEGNGFAKYNENQAGTKDGRIVLELSDDAAHTQWGGAWRMPTREEWKELYDNCDWEWTRQDGYNGYRVTSKKNGANIFLPAAGWRGGGSGDYEGVGGYYWSSSLYSGSSCGAFYCFFDSGGVDPSNWDGRSFGLSVRPVASSLQ